jgi:pimeloyl-ACP methyl ester carboxylesterase
LPTDGRRRFAAALAAALLAAPACAPVAERYDDKALAAGLARRIVEGDGFRHVVFQPPDAPRGGVLHIYIEGDGSPEVRPGVAAVDPTPRRPVLPALMALDPAPRLLLGRPCHHGQAALPPCAPGDWTGGRYAARVADSMAAAARRLLAEGGHAGAVLIGHSGGGVLALLLAARLPEVRAVVAVASVVDTEAWSRHHGQAPLAGSLNPRHAAPGRSGTPELFLAGEADPVSPAALVAAAAGHRPAATLRRYPGFDHACCWARAWPEALAWLAARGG